MTKPTCKSKTKCTVTPRGNNVKYGYCSKHLGEYFAILQARKTLEDSGWEVIKPGETLKNTLVSDDIIPVWEKLGVDWDSENVFALLPDENDEQDFEEAYDFTRQTMQSFRTQALWTGKHTKPKKAMSCT